MRKHLLLVALALGFAGCGGPPGTAPVRLLAAADVEVTGPSPQIESAGSGPPELAALPRSRVGRVVMAGAEERRDVRAALLAGDGTRVRLLVQLPAAPALRVALGYVVPEDEPAQPSDLRFRVEVFPVDDDGEPRGPGATALDERIPVTPDGGWRHREVPLPGKGGDRVLLELRTEAADGRVAAWAHPEVVSRGSQEEGWDVLFVSLDTLRADHVGSYGHSRPTSPRLDALAADGVRFAVAVAQAPWTRPSHRSMFNGLYPASHGGLTSPMLAALLWRAGYRTTAITGGGQVDPSFGFDEGIESYRMYQWVDAVEDVVAALLEGRGRKQFLFLHTYRIHDKYSGDAFTAGLPAGRIGASFGKHDWYALGKELTEEEKVYVEALYDGGIVVTDRALGELLDRMEASGLLDRTIVVVTSDHGEQFWEHGTWRHGQAVYDHQILVPLVVRLPPPLARRLGVAPGTVIEDQVQLVDLYPTLLELLGLPLEHRVQGRSVVPLLTGAGLPPADALSENTNVRDFERKSLRSERFKFIKSIPRQSARARGLVEPRYALFDLRRDPEEYKNEAERHPELVALLEQRLQLLHAGLDGLEEELPEHIDDDLRERLRGLGYLGE
jgi:arylsulfatase A-like enzyme